ncbi:MAG TPA: M14 metallopeptidase family protein [Gemmatimonadaceae bacterium]|nr:M14 metallopeptidase family protein [Gemmatimonadaceae bacterium]
MRSSLSRRTRVLALPLLFAASVLQAQGHITSPKEQFGHNIGDDYWLANYDQFSAYWHKLASESNRMKLVEIGKTAEGRPQLMAIISSPENMKHLDRYQEISRRLALAEGLTDEQARQLAEEGKAVVWIDGGLHATEVLGAHQLMQTVYDLVSRNDPETLRILRDCIILAVHVNPDGMQLVSNWYMQEPDSLKRNMSIPRLYEKYAGHDDNRDFYMANLPETQNDNRVMYWEWFPQIVYNHHQTGPAGTVMFAPPFRDPFNYNYDPLVVMGIDLVAASMHNRFEAEGKPGVTMRSGSSYSTWWNGGLRTMPYFHNMIGLLTETIGNPTPMRIPFVPAQQLPRADMPFPIAPQEWHFRQSIDYSVTANYAVLDIASRRRDEFLYNMYVMGKNSIARGSQDSWTASPKALAAVDSVVAQSRRGAAQGRDRGPVGDPVTPFGGGVDEKLYTEILHNPANRDPRGYIIPANQPDFPTATRFVNALRYAGITVLRATSDFTVNGKAYPRGSYVVKTAQAFRPHILDMFEPQDHPNDFAYPGGPPKRPYDNAGWTLAYQMGVQFDRVLDAFDGPFEKVDGLAKVQAGTVANASGATGFVFSHAPNNAFIVVNRLLKAGAEVYWLRSPMMAGGRTYAAGTFYVAASPAVSAAVRKAADETGVSFDGVSVKPDAGALKLQARRIALWDQYGGSMPSGWVRYELEQFEFPFDVVYPQSLDAGNLRSKYDVIIFPTGAVPGPDAARGRGGRGADASSVPAQYRGMLGSVTVDRTVPQLRKFLEDGGTILAVGTSTDIAYDLGLPVENALTERTPTGVVRPLSAEQFYVPGSILATNVDTTSMLAAGMPASVDVFYDNSRTFRLQPDAQLNGVRPVAWFGSATPLRSGWAWGQGYLEGGVAVAEAKVGKGNLYLFGPEITFRGQPHGTFKFLFNGIYAQ